MKTRKFLSIFVALSLILAYMIPFAGAAELFDNSVTWTFTDVREGVKLTNSSGKEKEWYVENTDLGNGLIAYAESSVDSNKNEYNRAFEIDRTAKASFGDEEVIGALKFGGKSTSTARYLTYVPTADGTLTAYVKHGSPSKANTDIRSLTVEQDGVVVGTVATVGTDNPNLKEDINVKGGIEVTIACDNNVALAKLVFTPGGSSEDPVTPATEAPTDTEAPADATVEPSSPTLDPSSTAAPVTKSVWYAKASDGDAMEPDSKNNTATIPAGKNISEGTDIAVYAMEALLYKDVAASFVDISGNALETAPEMSGRLTKSSTNPSKKDFGKSGASMKVVPSKNGTLSAYVKVSASATKLFYINDADGNVVAEYTNNSGESIYVRVDAVVEAGKEYYAYTDAAGTDFFGFEFTPSESPSETAGPSNTEEPSNTTAPANTTVPSTTAPSNTTAPVVGSDLPAVTASKSWIFDDYVNPNLASTIIVDNDLKVYGYEKMEIDGSNKTIGDVKYTTRLKFGGVGIFGTDGAPSGRVIEFLPGAAGTVKVAFAHASGSGDPRVLAVSQNGVERGSMSVVANATDVLTCTVAANAPVYIYGKEGGLNLYGVIFEAEQTTPKPTATSTPDPSATATPTPDTSATATPTPDTSATATPAPDPSVTAAPTAAPLDPDTQKAQADADALTLRSISDYAVYIDLDLVKKGNNGSTITWASSNEKYISIQEVSSNKSNYTGVVTRPTSDAECDETGGVPVTLTATVQYADAIVIKTFDVSVRKYNPIYYNDFQADVGEAAEGDYKGIRDNVKAANGDTFRGIRVASLDNTKSMYGFEHEDHDVESYFDKRIMSTDSVSYGDKKLVAVDEKNAPIDKPVAPDGTTPDENFAFYYQHYNPYGGGTTYMPLWIRLEDNETTSGYPEGLVVVSMDIYVIDGRQKFNIGIGTSKPAQMCRFLLNNGDQTTAGYDGAGVLRCFNEGNSWDYLDKNKYTIPKGKWITATIVANSSTHLWDFYFDGMQIRKGLLFRNAEDFISTIEFTMDRSSSYRNGKYFIDNISVENITDDYNATYWDELELEAPYSEEKEAYVVSSPFRLFYNGTDGLAGQVYSWKSSNTDLLKAGSKSVAVEDLPEYGFTESEIKKYTDKGVKYVTIALAEPVTDNIPEAGAYVTLKGSMEVGEKVYSKEFKIFVTKSTDDTLTDSEKALADLNAVTAVRNGMSITSERDIDLPKIGSLYSSEIKWESSDSDIIDKNGSVLLPSRAKQVTLTATAVNGTATETKKFTINVKAKSSTSGGGGGGGGSSFSSVSRVVGTVSTPTEKFETDAYTPEQSSKLIFNDIENVSWAKEAIETLYSKGVVSGYGNGLFAPNYSVTREQFVKMLVGALELDTNIASDISFSDVNGDEWYAPYINAAAVLGVVSGKDDGSFGVGESITRQDMAVMCIRALTVAGKAPAESDAAFNDSASISDYAKAAVSSMAGAGYLTGDENGSFNPLDTATRAQTAVVLYRIIQ